MSQEVFTHGWSGGSPQKSKLAAYNGARVEVVEAKMLQVPQVSCPVRHLFAEGIYIRELTLPADTFAIGHHQRSAVMNVMLSGRASMLCDDGSIKEISGPKTFLGQVGRKVGYIHETSVWLNIFPNPDNERNIEKLEARWLDKSAGFIENSERRMIADRLAHTREREDYEKLILELGVSQDEVTAMVEFAGDQVGFPQSVLTVTTADSPIHGKGLFSTVPIEEGQIICPARIQGKRTPAGRFTNHSHNPNAQMLALPNGDVALIALRGISGCVGGQVGDEITVDYRHAYMEGQKYKGVTQ